MTTRGVAAAAPVDPGATVHLAAGPGITRRPSSDGTPGASVHLRMGVLIPGTPYRIDSWLGEGGMGTVYEAEHMEIGRRVAVKILKNRLTGSQVDDLREEARASSKIETPRIIEVYDFRTLPDGRELIAMEYLDGVSLSSFAGKPVDPGRVIGILRQVCKGLGAAHRAGLVHRDVKPENIMLITREGRHDFVKIVDFGLCESINAAGRTSMVGTPRYMAPEVIQGEPSDERSDIYSLGCVAYQLLTGVPPFVEENLSDLLGAHLAADPRPPSELVGEAACPPALDAVILACLEKYRRDRPASVDDLEASLCEAQIEAGLVSAWDDLPLPAVDEDRRQAILAGMPGESVAPKRARWLVPALLGLIALLVIGGWALWPDEPTSAATTAPSVVDELADAAHVAAAQAYFVYPRPEDPERNTAFRHVLALEALSGEHRKGGRSRAETLREEFATTLVRLGDTYWTRDGGTRFAIEFYIQSLLFSGNTERARERAGITLAELAWLREKASKGDFSERELLEASFVNALADEDPTRREKRLKKVKRRPRKKRRLIQVSDDEAELLATLAPTMADATNERAPEQPGSEPDATSGGAEADVELDDGSGAGGTRGSARTLLKKGDAARRSGKLKDAEKHYYAALSRDKKSGRALAGLGAIAFERGEHNKAVDFYRRAVKYRSKDAGIRIRYGDALFKVSQIKAALTQYKRADALGSELAAGRIKLAEGKLGK